MAVLAPLTTFQVRLLKSREACWRVARWLGDYHELDVTVLRTRVAPRREDWRLYADHGDIELGPKRKRCEVKGCTYPFTCAVDHPYKHRPIVTDARVWDESDPKPWAIFLLNASMTHVAIVKGNTSGRWWTATITDGFRGQTKPYKIAPIDCFTFHDLRYAAAPMLRQRALAPPPMHPEGPRIQLNLFEADVVSLPEKDE